MRILSVILTISIIIFYFNSDSILAQENIEDRTIVEDIKPWQIKVGYSINNKDVTNLEGSYNLSLSKIWAFSMDARIWSFFTLSASFKTMPIKISEYISVSPKIGLGFHFPGPVAGLRDVSLNIGISVNYKINDSYNVFIEYLQLSKSSKYDEFNTNNKNIWVRNFPIRFISIGVEF